jgi:hypothetical protein
LYYTIDSGKTWHKDYRMPNVAVHEIKMREDRTLFAFTHGRGMFALPLKATKVGTRNFDRDGRLQAKIYPNPSSGSISVRGAMSMQNLNYGVYNLQGDKVMEGRFGEGSSSDFGSGDFGSIPTANLPNGTYFLKVFGEGSRTFTSKFIIQH